MHARIRVAPIRRGTRVFACELDIGWQKVAAGPTYARGNLPDMLSRPLLVGAFLLAAAGCPAEEGSESSTDQTSVGTSSPEETTFESETDVSTSSSSGNEVESTSESETDTDTDTESDSDTDAPPQVWHSQLYPEDWTPEHTDDAGRFLHDFSYAGYRHSEAPLAQALADLEIDVVLDHGADPTGQSDSSPALTAAIAQAEQAGGAIIFFPEGLYRLDAPIVISSSNIVLRGAGPKLSRLWMTASEGMSHKSHIRFRGALTYGEPLDLVADAQNRATTLEVADASSLQPGSAVVVGWTISEAFVEEHGMDGTWMAFNDTWQPFFWRRVTAVDTASTPNRVTLDVPLRYPALMRDQANLRTVAGALREVGVEQLGIADAVSWDAAWEQDQVHVLEFDGVVDSWIRDIESFASPGAPNEGLGAGRHLQSGGILVRQANRVTVRDCRLEAPQNRGGGGNGYLFEVRQSSEVLFADLVGLAGRHNFIQNWGFGASGIVWLRIVSSDGVAVPIDKTDTGFTGYSEFHHSLATANLIDNSELNDGWSAVNRGSYSSGAGHSATQSVLWNLHGTGLLRSRQFGHGYVIGPAPSLQVETQTQTLDGWETEPEDWVEGADQAGSLEPTSLFEDQLMRRLGG